MPKVKICPKCGMELPKIEFYMGYLHNKNNCPWVTDDNAVTVKHVINNVKQTHRCYKESIVKTFITENQTWK